MPGSKIVNEQEAIAWIEEGRTYAWMVEEYRRKYNLETTQSMWSNFRNRRGLARRINRDDELIPWDVLPKHRWAYPLRMLRVLGRQRAGFDLTDIDASRLESFMNELGDEYVVHYDPELPEGFVLTPREPKDTDVVRRPITGLTKRKRDDGVR